MDTIPQLEPLYGLIEGLDRAARESALRLRRYQAERKRKRRGDTLRPGVDTPLWNELLVKVRPLLKKRGEKALLARLLGVPRQRVHEYLQGRSRMPDAEHTLLLMAWLAARQRGIKLG